jgi:competence protein ComEC
MIDLRRAPVVRALVPFTAGSLAGYLGHPVPGQDGWALPCLILCLAIWLIQLLLFFFCLRVPQVRAMPFSLISAGLFFLTGLGTGALERPEDPGLPEGERIMVSGLVMDGPVERNGRIAFTMGLRMAGRMDTAHPVRTIVKATMEMPSDSLLPESGESWRLCGRPVAIQGSGNPGEPDYPAMMQRKGCWYRFYCDTLPGLNVKVAGIPDRRLNAARIRRAVAALWEGPPESVSLLKAVCLGDRSGLNEEMRQSYARAGGMHLLAVSGLHVGLIWWVLHRILSFMVRLFRREVCRAVPVTLLIWFYAYVTGFSSSVCRSVTMFTFFSAARLTGHRGHPVNAVLVSAFFLVTVHPGRALDVGFQLSYAAILAIVTLHPVLKSLIRLNNPVLKYVWEGACVSIAAQAGTLPLVIHYFHQAPLYALFTNLLAIPLLSCIIALFVASVPLVAAGIGAGPVNRLLVFLGGMMNRVMETVSSIPGSVVGNLFPDPLCMLLFMVAIFLAILIANRRGRLPVYLLMLTVCLILFRSAQVRDHRVHSSQLVVGHFNGASMVTMRQGLQVDHYIWCGDPEQVAYMDRYIESAWGNRCYETSVVWTDRAFSAESRSQWAATPLSSGGISACSPLGCGAWIVGSREWRGLVVTGVLDEEKVGILSDVKPDFILLSGEPPLSPGLKELLASISCDVIADGSNRAWYRDRLGDLCGQVYVTGKKGAYLEPV